MRITTLYAHPACHRYILRYCGLRRDYPLVLVRTFFCAGHGTARLRHAAGGAGTCSRPALCAPPLSPRAPCLIGQDDPARGAGKDAGGGGPQAAARPGRPAILADEAG